MSLSIAIPIYNEEKNLPRLFKNLNLLKKKIIDLEIICINDFSSDNSKGIILKYSKKKKFIKLFNNKKKGLGAAIQLAIKKSKKKYVCIFMSDLSDDKKDLIRYYNTIKGTQYNAIFGSRFVKGSTIINYPKTKFILNRIFNNFVKYLLFSKYNDFTNAFKIYERKMLISFLPIISESFNVFLELPLKVICRNFRYKIIPISWKDRNVGSSNFKIKELGSLYFFTLFYCLIEKILLNKKNVH